MDERQHETCDVVVIGGGAAGLSAAAALARSRRSVLVVDAGDPRNAVAGHVHNFLTRDGASPAEICDSGRAEVRRYGGRIEPGEVTAVRRQGADFRVEFGERTVGARRILVSTGARDALPDIPGLAERWGTDVLHCPYCHGWEVRDQRIGVLSTGPMAEHQALLFGQLSADVTVLQHTGPALTDEQREQLDAVGIDVVDGTVVQVDSDAGRLTAVRLSDGRTVALDALVVSPLVQARAEALAALGLHPQPALMGDHVLGTRIEADATGATSVPGVWVAGNVTDVMAQVVASAAAGLVAGAAINADLIRADAGVALDSSRYQRAYGEQAWDERYRARPQNWSGNPNPVLVAETAGLAPGIALDAGSGEGADAVWLASRGWAVTGAELSQTALERSAAEADRLGLDIDWQHVDLTREAPPGRYDLVSAFYLQLPLQVRTALFTRLAAAVTPGGTLLIVGHDFRDLDSTTDHPHLDTMGWTTDEIVDLLDDDWVIEVAESRPRPMRDPDGREIDVHDAVLRARRRLREPAKDPGTVVPADHGQGDGLSPRSG